MNHQAGAGELPAETGSKWRGLGVRSLATAVMVPLALAFTWAGGAWFAAALAAVGLVMSYEWCHMVHGGDTVQRVLHAVAVMLAAGFSAGLYGWPLPLAGLALVWALSLVKARTGAHLNQWTLAGVPYVALPVFALALLRQGEWGLTAVLWVLITVWCADVGAFFAGRIIGGPRLAPMISPKKTWAGLAGAVVAAMIASFIAWRAAQLPNAAAALILGALCGVVEQLGDLFESAAKRHYHLKDSSHLIPGHGGVLDRVDGLVAAAMAAALLGLIHSGGGTAADGFLNW